MILLKFLATKVRASADTRGLSVYESLVTFMRDFCSLKIKLITKIVHKLTAWGIDKNSGTFFRYACRLFHLAFIVVGDQIGATNLTTTTRT